MAEESTVDTQNEFFVGSHAGLIGIPFTRIAIQTRQQGFRLAAWIEVMSETLPDEPLPSTMEEIRTAIRNT